MMRRNILVKREPSRLSIAIALAIAIGGGVWFFLTIPSVPPPPVAEQPTAPVESPATPASPVTPVAPPVPPVTLVVPIVPPVPEIPANFIVSDNLWQNASHHAGWVQFAGVPVGTKLYAPVGGWHVHVRQMTFEGTIFSAIILAQNPNWGQGDLAYQETMRNMLFIARWIEVTNFNPREGEIFAEIKDTSFFPAVYAYFDEKTVLVITTDAIWAEKADFSITDPKTYLRTIIEKIN